MNAGQSPIERNAPFAVPGPYQTKLSNPEEVKFQQWVKSNNVPMEDDGPQASYDMRGYWKDIASKGQNQTEINPVDKLLHFPDTYKTPYHPTFSNESKYATPDNPFYWKGQTQYDRRSGEAVGGVMPKTKSLTKSLPKAAFTLAR